MTTSLKLPPGQLSPRQFIRDIVAALPLLTERELAELKERARAWAVVFYSASVPEELEYELNELEAKHAAA